MGGFGTIIGAGEVRFERLLPGPIERVWEHLADSEKRGLWLARGPMELRVGGAVSLEFHHDELTPHDEPIPEKHKEHACGSSLAGRVTQCDPPRLLAFTWGEGSPRPSEAMFELIPQGAQVLLRLTHRRLADRKEMLSVAGGWHTHLDILVARARGETPLPFWSTHAALEAEYDKRIAQG